MTNTPWGLKPNYLDGRRPNRQVARGELDPSRPSSFAPGPIEAPEWFSGLPAPTFASRAERIEYLATGAPAPLRLAAGMLLALDAWTAPFRTRVGGTARRRPSAHGIGRAADRLTQAASRRIDRLAEADRRVARRVERRLAFLHPVKLVRNLRGRVCRHRRAGRHGRRRAGTERPRHGGLSWHPRGRLDAGRRAARTAGGATLVSAPPPTPTPADAAGRGPLPVGKGMWLYQPQATEGGNAARIVSRAKAVGLTHLYVRTGSSIDGFNAAPFLNELLPVAHASGLRVIGWDYPYLHDVAGDLARAAAAIGYRTPDGHRLDGFAADVEPWDGANLTPTTAAAYSTGLRHEAGAAYPLIACVPRPNPELTRYPFSQLLPAFDAVAPMIYWMGNDPAAAATVAFADLAPYGKPIIPVGQAYDGGPDGGPKGVPSPAEIQRFIAAADQLGAIGVSFWSWQAADQPAWDTIRQAPQFVLGPVDPASLSSGQIRAYQAALTSLGYPVSASGVLDQPSRVALRAYQQAANVGRTGTLDTVTQSLLLAPISTPVVGHG